MARTTNVGDSMIADLKRLNEYLAHGHTLAEAEQAGIIRTSKVQVRTLSEDARLTQQARASLSLSQSEFAKWLGVSVQFVEAWEQGQRIPSPIRLMFKHIVAKPTQWADFVAT